MIGEYPQINKMMNNDQKKVFAVYTGVIGPHMSIFGRLHPQATVFRPNTPIGRETKDGQDFIYLRILQMRELDVNILSLAVESSLIVGELDVSGHRYITFKIGSEKFEAYNEAHAYYREDELFEMFDS
ncbi:hypothetical protein BGZ58_004206 [Dissophora ornata]|nr:hypothetical protein BGZ58_004206 [Dissophora ornata]